MGAASIWIGLLAAGAVVTGASAQPAGSVATGEALYEAKCSGCHSLDANRIGPRHRGVVGRKLAGLPDFDYSDALRKLGGVWTPDRLDTWLQGPQAMAPGAKMFLTVPDPQQRRDIIAYLTSVSKPVTSLSCSEACRPLRVRLGNGIDKRAAAAPWKDRR
jgi:cytochrome c